MTGFWLFSHLALWAATLSLALASLALARQLKALRRQATPGRSRQWKETFGPEAPRVGEKAPEVNAHDLNGGAVSLSNRRKSLLVFVSAGCGPCGTLAPALKEFQVKHGEVDLIVIGMGGNEEADREFVARHHLDGIPYVSSVDLGMRFAVPGTPFAVLVDERGVLKAGGWANALEHLEALIGR